VKAARIHRYGDADVFQIDEVERPQPGPDDLLVRVCAAGVNPIDWKIRMGSQKAFIRYRLPWILGLDVSGVVEAVGERVTDFAPGDSVYSVTDYKRPGSYAEYMLVDHSIAAHKPERLSHEEAAGVPLAGLTAWQCLVTSAGIGPGDRVFIQAGSGGVGTFAIQIAKALGAHVTTTCSTRNVELVKRLGADEVVDYTKQDYAEVVRDQDMVLDSLGGEHRARVLPCLKTGGKHVSIVSDIPPKVKRYGALLGPVVAVLAMVGFAVRALVARRVRSAFVLQRPSGEQLGQLAELIDAGKVTPMLDSTFALEDIAEAHRQSESKRAQGKIVVVP
jgi:alcohol dehydrogenase